MRAGAHMRPQGLLTVRVRRLGWGARATLGGPAARLARDNGESGEQTRRHRKRLPRVAHRCPLARSVGRPSSSLRPSTNL